MSQSSKTNAARVQALLDSGDLVGASRLLDGADDRNNPDMLVLTSRLLRLRGRGHEAFAHAEQALKADAQCVPALIELARSYGDRGEVDRAQEAFEEAHRLAKAPGPWVVEWAEFLCAHGRLEDAQRVLRAYCKQEPERPEGWFCLGLAYQRARRFTEALDAYGRVEQLVPTWPMLKNNMAAAYLEMNDWARARSILESTVVSESDNALAWNNLAVALCKSFDLAGAQVAAERALALAPNLTNALQTYSHILKELQQWEAAIAVIRRALELDPENPGLIWSHAMLQLALGDDRGGWVNHEARWHGSPELRDLPSGPTSPRWKGESLDGKTLFVWGEQGFGDAMQFVRFVPAIAQRVQREGGKLVYCGFAELLSLFGRSLAGVVETVVPHNVAELPAHDFHLPLASLPLMLGISYADLPVGVRYLRADDDRVQQWERRLNDNTAARLRVGLVWSGNPKHQRNPLRSVEPIAYAEAFKNIEGVEFVNLQLGAQAQVQAMRQAGLALTDPSAELHSFDDTAALLVNLDLVITVCTSVAHLAGALGVPTWVLLDVNPHWVWMTARSDSPWYPSVTLYRQPQYRQWASVLERVAADLASYAKAPRHQRLLSTRKRSTVE